MNNLKTLFKKRVKTSKKSKTYKNKALDNSLASFQKEITMKFFEMILMIKLFHWKTYSYSTHKATDKLYEDLNGHMDRFMEVLLGKSGIRMNFMNQKTIPLYDLDSQEKLIEKVNQFKSYLVNLLNKKSLENLMLNTGLLNIRDEILEDMNQFLYLLSLK
jgi:DNA-binding ferritin-like protein